VYGTSLVNRNDLDPAAKFELNGVRFVDMPWFTLRDHPAVAIYPRPAVPVTSELERLYALGIDAYRLALEIMTVPSPGQVTLDGVTGYLMLDDARQFQRELTPMQFLQGEIRPWPEQRR
jgi:outer membrane PBP1 activator LpoA protein